MSWTLIESQTLGSSVASVTLGNGGTIPQTYKTLKLVISARSDKVGAPSEPLSLQPNAASTNLTLRLLEGNGSNAISGTNTYLYIGAAPAANATANTFCNSETTIPNYSGSTNKTMTADAVQENNSATVNETFQDLSALLWSDTTAITSLKIVLRNSGNFVSGSSFTLYGLK